MDYQVKFQVNNDEKGLLQRLFEFSGCGKTTLLQLIAGRGQQQKHSSGILCIYNCIYVLGEGSDRPPNHIRRQIGFVYQDDTFLTPLSVREHLSFTAQLKLSSQLTYQQKCSAIDQTIEIFGLEFCADTPICYISGGERKRCSVASELFSNPRLLMLDEPTSGLDSAAATNVINVLRLLAKPRPLSNSDAINTASSSYRNYHFLQTKSMGIMMSIHQPSTHIFESFDKVIILSEGSVAYFGPPSTFVNYIESLGLRKIDYLRSDEITTASSRAQLLYGNPADIAIELLMSIVPYQSTDGSESIGEDSSHPQCTKLEREDSLLRKYDGWWPRYILIDIYQDNDVISEIDQNIDSMMFQGTSQGTSEQLTRYFETVILTRRCLKLSSRSLVTKWLAILEILIVSTLAGLSWLQIQFEEDRISDVSGFFFFCLSYWFFAKLFVGILVFQPDNAVIRKEYTAGTYRLLSYFTAKFLGNIPVTILSISVFTIISFLLVIPATTFPSYSDYIIVLLSFFGMITLLSFTAEHFGELVGNLAYSIEQSVSVATLVGLSTLIFGGFYIKTLPIFMQWLQYLSILKYGFDAVVQIVFSRKKHIMCNVGGFVIADCFGQVFIDSDEVMHWLGVSQFTTIVNIAILVVSCCALKFGAFLALYYFMRKH